MIVRDEAESLPRALQSVQGVVDQVVVVDTGSRDSTLDVARRFGAQIARMEWADDFAAARNRSLALAAGEWILVLDADEELAPEARGQLPPLLAAPGVEGYLVQILSLTGPEPGPDADQAAALRLFRNRPGYQFEGALHEQVAPSILRADPEAKLVGCSVRILHHGYLEDIARQKGKHERNLRILRKMLSEAPDSGVIHCHLGVEAATANLWPEAAVHFRTALDLAEAGAIWRPQAVKYHAMALGQLERWAEMHAFLAAELPRYPRYTDLYYLNGLALHRSGRPAGALNAYRQCLALGAAPSPPYTAVTPAMGGAMALLAMGLVQEEQGSLLAAARAYMRALQAYPAWRAPLLRFVSLLERAGGGASLPEEVAAFAASQPAATAAWVAGLFVHLNRYDIALRCLEGALARGYEGPDAQYLLALSLYRLGRHAEALQACKRAAEAAGGSAALLALRCACLLGAGDTRAARAMARRSPAPEFYTALASLVQGASPDRLAEALRAVPDPEALRRALAGGSPGEPSP